MLKQMELNRGCDRDFLAGAEESEVFGKREYVKLHRSAMTKVYWFGDTYRKFQARKLTTARANIWNRINAWLERPLVKLLGFLSVLLALFQIAL
ncbi:MAG: hypothetical protein ABL962_15100, partial [Fimbriimonadaceae bacterium]